MNQLAQFDGETVEARDRPRLVGQLERVKAMMAYGEWLSLADIAECIRLTFNVYDSEPGISARLRDLRKERFGGHTVERRRRAGGLWEYRVVMEGDQ